LANRFDGEWRARWVDAVAAPVYYKTVEFEIEVVIGAVAMILSGELHSLI